MPAAVAGNPPYPRVLDKPASAPDELGDQGVKERHRVELRLIGHPYPRRDRVTALRRSVRGQAHNAARFQFGAGGPNAVGGMSAGVGVFALDRYTVGFAVVQHPLLCSRFPLTQSRAVSRPCLAMMLDRWVPWLLWWEGPG